MLRKAHVFGLLAAALAVAPAAALADQVQGSSSNTTQTSVTSGINNVTAQSANTRTAQQQSQKGSPFCNSGNQIQASNASAAQASALAGLYNVTGQTASTDTYQRQIAKAQGYLCR